MESQLLELVIKLPAVGALCFVIWLGYKFMMQLLEVVKEHTKTMSDLIATIRNGGGKRDDTTKTDTRE
jgi:hypothetical protein